MAMTKEFLDGIEFEIVKQKYYNANKVNAVFDELKAGACALLDENAALKAELDALKATGDAEEESALVISAANDLADRIVSKARLEADDMINGARKVVDAARAEEAKAKASADKILAKAQAIDAQVTRIITSAREQRGSLSDRQVNAIDNILAQIDEFSMAQETRLLKIRQLLMGIVTDNG